MSYEFTDEERRLNTAMFEKWLADGETWIGIFENHDLGHYDIGRRIAMSFDDSLWDKAELKKTRSPDHKAIGFGWRYLLICRTHDVAEAEMFIEHKEPKT